MHAVGGGELKLGFMSVLGAIGTLLAFPSSAQTDTPDEVGEALWICRTEHSVGMIYHPDRGWHEVTLPVGEMYVIHSADKHVLDITYNRVLRLAGEDWDLASCFTNGFSEILCGVGADVFHMHEGAHRFVRSVAGGFMNSNPAEGWPDYPPWNPPGTEGYTGEEIPHIEIGTCEEIGAGE